MEILRKYEFNEKDFKNSYKPFIFAYCFPNLHNLSQVIDFDYLKKNIKVQTTKISTFNSSTFDRSKIETTLNTGIDLITNSKRGNIKYGIIAMNSRNFSSKLLNHIFIPKIVESSNYVSINAWAGQKGYITSPHFDTVSGILLQLKGKKGCC